MVEGGGLERKKRERKYFGKKEKQAGAGGRRHTLFLPPSPPPPPPFSSSLANENEREERSGGPQGPNRSAPALSLTLQSSPFPSIPSILHPSLCPQQSLYSSVFISLPLPPSLAPSLRQLSCCYSL